MRYTRLRKFAKGKFPNSIKVFAIVYIAILNVAFLLGQTGAYYSSTEKVTGTITAGTWETEKNPAKFLQFPNEDKDRVIKTCGKAKLEVSLRNIGNERLGPIKYEVYSLKGKQKSLIDSGTVRSIDAKETIELKYMTTQAGTYQFKAWLEGEKSAIWSELITVDCHKEKSIPKPESEPKDQPENNPVQNPVTENETNNKDEDAKPEQTKPSNEEEKSEQNTQDKQEKPQTEEPVKVEKPENPAVNTEASTSNEQTE
ncbi:amyloid fiber anchoring/assembly protein TapA [Bacillus rubiinfantis]|uniref:amyloid fiber anchoring/assembly protein TapA n=1 Tax=Bacillus rubiinfantis TaxID=1499680 RepID=UPI0005AA0015|nr:amyloid fiber anchoring/assembly protein TapA [Bacillus rubiinfantis]